MISRDILTNSLFNQINAVDSNPAEIKKLLDLGADYTEKRNNKTPIFLAADQEKWKIVQVFAGYPTNQDDKAQYGQAILVASSFRQKNKSTATVRALLKQNHIKVNVRYDDTHNTALHEAVFYKRPKQIALLLSYGWDPYAKNMEGESPFEMAAKRSSDCLKIFIDHEINKQKAEAEAEAEKKQARTKKLFDLIQSENPSLDEVKALIQQGINAAATTITEQCKYTPIVVASDKDQWDIVKLLLENTNTDNEDNLQYGAVVLNAAASKTDQTDLIRTLLEKSPFISTWDFKKTNNTALHLAVKKKNLKQIALLLNYGWKANKKNNLDQSPGDLAQTSTKCLQIFADLPETRKEKLKSTAYNLTAEEMKEELFLTCIAEAQTLKNEKEIQKINLLEEFIDTKGILNYIEKILPELPMKTQQEIDKLISIIKLFTFHMIKQPAIAVSVPKEQPHPKSVAKPEEEKPVIQKGGGSQIAKALLPTIIHLAWRLFQNLEIKKFNEIRAASEAHADIFHYIKFIKKHYAEHQSTLQNMDFIMLQSDNLVLLAIARLQTEVGQQEITKNTIFSVFGKARLAVNKLLSSQKKKENAFHTTDCALDDIDFRILMGEVHEHIKELTQDKNNTIYLEVAEQLLKEIKTKLGSGSHYFSGEHYYKNYNQKSESIKKTITSFDTFLTDRQEMFPKVEALKETPIVSSTDVKKKAASDSNSAYYSNKTGFFVLSLKTTTTNTSETELQVLKNK